MSASTPDHGFEAPPVAASSGAVLFLGTALIAPIAAGVFLFGAGAAALTTIWAPQTLALTHLGTIGFVTLVLLGLLLERIPAATRIPVERPGIAVAVYGLLVAGLLGLEAGLLVGATRAAFASISLLALALVALVYHVGPALWRTARRVDEVAAMRLALASLFLAGFLGVWMAHGHADMRFPGPRALWIQVHLTVAFFGWVGGALCAFSWHTLPADYGAAPCRPPVVRATLALVAAGIVLPVTVLLLDFAAALPNGGAGAPGLAAVGAVPAVIGIWALQPLAALRALSASAGERRDGGRLLWQTGFVAALLSAAAAVASQASPDPRFSLWLGWFAIWGWAGASVHALLRRRAESGGDAIPTRRDPRSRDAGWAATLHVATLVVGAAAIGQGGDGLARATGVLMAVTGVHLLLTLLPILVRPASEGVSPRE